MEKAFLLCREIQKIKSADENGVYSFETRGLIGFEGLNHDDFWPKLQQSARKDSSKVIRKLHRVGVFAEETTEIRDVIDFVSMHNSLQARRGFLVPHKFRIAELQALVNLQNWHLLKISKDGVVIGYTILAVCEDVTDQVFLVYNNQIRDASRFVIYGSLDYAIRGLSVSQYFMGGGIVESDNLERYKLSLGAKKNMARILKYCAFKSKDYFDGIQLEGVRWP